MKQNRHVIPKNSAPEQSPSRPSQNGVHGQSANGALQMPSTPKEIVANGERATNAAPHADTDAAPGPFINSRMDYWVVKKDRPEIRPDRDVIVATAWNGSGEAVVREHHVAKFNSFWADAEAVLREVVRDMAANVRSGEAHLRELARHLARTDRYVEVERKSQPWTFWERAQLVGILFFSFLLLGVDVNSAAITLLESGIDSFRNHYWRAAMFNLSVIVGGVFLIKSVANWQETDFARRRYALVMIVLAAISLIAAVPIFAQTYSRLAADPLAAMATLDTVSHSSNSWWTFALQLVVGNLVAGAMWLTAARIVEIHRPSVRAENPMWARVKGDLDKQAAGLREEREKVGLFQGKLDIIGAKRHQLVTRAVELYRLAAVESERSRKTASLLNQLLDDQDKNNEHDQ
jgi:hypothetical protein